MSKPRTLTEIDHGRWMTHPALADFSVSWSSDSRWIAYSRGVDNRQSAVFLYDTASGERHQVTAGFVDCASPVFDPGRRLPVLPLRPFVRPQLLGASIRPGSTPTHQRGRRAAAQGRGLAVGAAQRRRDDRQRRRRRRRKATTRGRKRDDDDKAEAEPKVDPVKIDLEGFEARAVVLPPDAGRYSELGAVDGKVLYHPPPAHRVRR